MQRYLYDDIKSLALSRNKMAFISGPRQVGKTTLAKNYSQEYDQALYKNWDESQFRRLWTKSPNDIKNEFDLEKLKQKRLVIFDEIHKSKGWKQKLKGLFDEIGNDLNIIVTGSARLNIFKKGGDSLMGRYLNFRLHPLSYGEVTVSRPTTPETWKANLFIKPKKDLPQEPLERLLALSGFPEPFFSGSEKILRIWRQSRNEKIIREDLRDLSRLPELSQVEMLASLLPEKVGSTLSIQSLREDLEVAHGTVSRWLKYLNELFYFFEIKPWSKSVPRSLKKEGKIYLYDWTDVCDAGPRFENMVACHLLKACHYWTDTGEGHFELYYLRNKDKQEIDFLIVKDKKPWLCIEAKIKDTQINKNEVQKFLTHLKCPFIQVVRQNSVWRAENNMLVTSATYALSELP
nr:ATP-binding protein [Bdellovibrio sp. HAGR004]